MNRFLKVAAILSLALLSLMPRAKAQTGGAGTYRAVEYGQWSLQVNSSGANPTGYGTTAGAGTYSLSFANGGAVVAPGGNPGGAKFVPVAIDVPITVGTGASQETVVPTSVSGCSLAYTGPNGCTVTAVFAYGHGPGTQVISGDFGLEEAVNAAAGFNTYSAGSTASSTAVPAGGLVVIDKAWGGNLVSTATGTTVGGQAITPFSNVALMDTRGGNIQYWNITPLATTVLSTPTTLVSTTVAPCPLSGACGTVAGSASWGSTTYAGITCVDIMGNESPVSASYSFTSTASTAIGFTAPAAQTGCVGWKPYLSVSGGTYALMYSIPLTTQPTTLGAGPVASGVCTLTTLETITPACAITNATYGQTGSAAIVTGYPVVTSQLSPQAASASAATYNPNNSGHTIWGYAPGSHIGIPGVVAENTALPITTAMQSTIPAVAGSIFLPPNFMNSVGHSIQVCGFVYKTSTTADTIDNFQLWWDAEGSNVSAGTPVQLSNIEITQTLTAAPAWHFCQTITTTVAAAGATGGTILPGDGYLTESQVAAGTIHSASTNVLFAPVASLNLALNARIDVIYNHTTGTDGTGVILLNPTVTVLN